MRIKTVWGVHKQNFRFNLTLEDPRKYHERVQAWETDGNSVCDLVLLFLDMKVAVLKFIPVNASNNMDRIHYQVIHHVSKQRL